MNKNIFIKGVAAVMMASTIIPSLTSCKEDYLETAPVSDYSSAIIGSSIEGARGAMTGLLQGMYRQLEYLNPKSVNRVGGEGWMMTFYGEVFGNTTISNMYCGSGTSQEYANWIQLMQEDYYGPFEMWKYAYNQIYIANMIIENIDNLPYHDGERDYIKAVALTVRAHCYIQLLRVYAPNWENANNGDVYCCIIRTESSTEELPFSTMNQVKDLIYSDLNTAISLYESSGWEREFIWQPNVDVARGIYSRIAMVFHEYELARDMAKAARANYPIMSAEEYLKGFITANDEYLWSNFYEVPLNSVNRYVTGSMNTCNGYSTTTTARACNAIDYDFYKKFPMTDIRKGLYLTPELIELNPTYANGITKEEFWDPNKTYTNGMRIQLNNYNDNIDNFLYDYGDYMFKTITAANSLPSGDNGLLVYPYDEYTYNNMQVLFGAQYKFWGVTKYSEDQWPWLRAAELAYTEAEAEYFLQNEPRAREIMNELNKGIRDPNYNCTASGTALLQEIKDYREFELWGEGHNWFDMKRWHDPIVRKGWVANDVNSGNRAEGFTQTFDPDAYYGWRVPVPVTEFNSNKAAQRSVLPGGNR